MMKSERFPFNQFAKVPGITWIYLQPTEARNVEDDYQLSYLRIDGKYQEQR